jgi:hypothetical protein
MDAFVEYYLHGGRRWEDGAWRTVSSRLPRSLRLLRADLEPSRRFPIAELLPKDYIVIRNHILAS